VGRRLKIELAEDEAGVRIDVTTPKRIDLAVREAQAKFEYRHPELEAARIEAAEAFVRGDGPRERTHADSLFAVEISGQQRDVWDLARVRVSAPGDVIGELSGHRYIDLAPSSEESRLFAALAEQETVRLRWITEGVEIVYRLPAEHRESWRVALATNETWSDEERAAHYEELLTWGMATKSELPFYRRVTPRRPRRNAEAPASPIPFFARRSGSVPAARRPTVAGVRLPPGRRGPDSYPSYWISDEPLEACGAAASSIARAFAETGLWPLVWPWDEDPAAYLDRPVEPDRVDAVDVEAVFRRGWERVASHPAGLLEPIGPSFPGLATGSRVDPGAAANPFELAGLLEVRARLMIVPCNRPADCVALIGGLAVEVGGAEISAVIRSWEDRFGAVLVSVQPSQALLAVTSPPGSPEQALGAAAERMAFCPPESVEPGTLEQLASIVRGELLPAGAEAWSTGTWSVWPVAWYD
jgi:Domain of unknown function (DUF4253)